MPEKPVRLERSHNLCSGPRLIFLEGVCANKEGFVGQYHRAKLALTQAQMRRDERTFSKRPGARPHTWPFWARLEHLKAKRSQIRRLQAKAGRLAHGVGARPRKGRAPDPTAVYPRPFRDPAVVAVGGVAPTDALAQARAPL